MIGSRPLTQEEIKYILLAFHGHYAARNRALFVLGLKTGFRISELLSLKVCDVYQDGAVLDSVGVHRSSMKGTGASRRVPLNQEAKEALLEWLNTMGNCRPETWLFESQRRGKPLDASRAWVIFEEAYDEAGVDRVSKLGTHCMRKTFAQGVYQALGHDLVKTQRALGHKSINSTVAYLGFGTDTEINEAIMSL